MELPNLVILAIGIFGAGGAVGSWLNQWLRNRREDRVRWHAERRAAYERLLTAGEKLNESGLVVAEHIGNLRQLTGWGEDPVFDEVHLLREAEKLADEWSAYCVSKVRSERSMANAAHEQVMSALAAIDMISDPAVVDAAHEYHDALHAVAAAADDTPPRECGGWSDAGVAATEHMCATRDAFILATRKELGVT